MARAILIAVILAASARHLEGRSPNTAAGAPTERVRLTVWTSTLCPPCNRFWKDLNSDSAFRSQLCGVFVVEWYDALHPTNLARRTAAGVSSWPTFIDARGRRVVGYFGKADLLRRLGVQTSPNVTKDSTDEFRLPIPGKSKPAKPKPKPKPQPDVRSLALDRLRNAIAKAFDSHDDRLNGITTAIDAINRRINDLDPQGSISKIPGRVGDATSPPGVSPAASDGVADSEPDAFATLLKVATPYAIGAGGPAAGVGVWLLGAWWRRRKRRRSSTPSPEPATPAAEPEPESEPAAPQRYRDYAEQLAANYAANGGRDSLWDQHLGRVLQGELEQLKGAQDETIREVISGVLERSSREVNRIFTKGAERSATA